MIFGKLLNKEGNVEKYEKREMADIIPFRPRKGLEELKLIDISRPAKRAHGRQTGNAPLSNNPTQL